MHIGIDVGGTNTDAVLMDGTRVASWIKSPTTDDVTTGVLNALTGLLGTDQAAYPAVSAVAIGTTHFTNAVIQRDGLAQTAAIRLGLPASAGVPPLSTWPPALVQAIGGHAYMVRGGHEFDGREIAALDEDELRRIATEIAGLGVTSVAITGIFSPATAEMEERAAAIIREEAPHIAISLSHEIGRIGLLERENATVINASLLPAANKITMAFSSALKTSGLDAPVYLSQNDGTLMDADFVRRYPVATFAAGPTNSMRGAALLSGLKDCIVVDVGGTTTDIGAVVNGFPRPATTEVDVGGVRTNFRMPDVVSLGIGGGSTVSLDGTVGPTSVGHRLQEDALCFGGTVLTATDLAVASGAANMGTQAPHVDPEFARAALAGVRDRVAAQADTMKMSAESIPLVLVGGGSILLPDEFPGFGEVVRPAEFAVANAIGAAIAQVGGEVDRIFLGETHTRDQMLTEAADDAVSNAIQAGATPSSVAVVEVDEIPIAYLPGNAVRVRVKAVGDLDLTPPRGGQQ